MSDVVKNPNHYKGDGKVTCMDAMESMTSGIALNGTATYWWLAAFKYLWRWPLKGGLEDLLKCRQSIDYLIDARYPEAVYGEEQQTLEME